MASANLQLTRTPVSGRIPLVCIPGTYCSPEVFELLDETLLPDFQLLPVSWMTSPGPWDISTLGERVALLLQELNLGPAILVGHSSGGPIALVAALSRPALVRGLLLADTGANTQGHGDIAKIIPLIRQGATSIIVQQLLKRSFYQQPDEALLQSLLSYALQAPAEAAIEALTSQDALDLVARLPAISVPVLLVHGKYDQARPLYHAELLANHLPHAELRVLESGHTPMVEARADYEQALLRLIQMCGMA